MVQHPADAPIFDLSFPRARWAKKASPLLDSPEEVHKHSPGMPFTVRLTLSAEYCAAQIALTQESM